MESKAMLDDVLQRLQEITLQENMSGPDLIISVSRHLGMEPEQDQ